MSFISYEKKKILVVEDEAVIADSVQRCLMTAGYLAENVATSATEAIECAERSTPDLVLMDINIQGEMDGIDTAGVLRKRFQVPIIYLTAHEDSATLERAKVTEPLGYLVKPLNLANLPCAIEVALHKHSLDGQRQSEERQNHQEQKMFSVAQLASDIAQDFYGLFDLVARTGEDLRDRTPDEDESGQHSVRLIQQAGDAGASIARQLLDFGKHQTLRPELLSLNAVLEERKSLYQRLCGSGISVRFCLAPKLDQVLSHTLHLEKLILNLILSAKHSMPNGGSILVSTANTARPAVVFDEKPFVKLLVEVQRNAAEGSSASSSSSANSELTLAVVNTIVTVNEGVLSTSHQDDNSSTTEVLLPAFAAGKGSRVLHPSSFPAYTAAVGLPEEAVA